MDSLKQHSPHTITICSDSVGETAERVARATMRQFDGHEVNIRRLSHIKNEDEIRTIMEGVSRDGGFVVYTLVQPELREMMREEAIRLGVRAVDIMGPMMQAFIDTFNDSPNRKVGMMHQLDEEYFKRIEAVEFTVRCDDGHDTTSLMQADIVLLGLSRTSKTPLSIFLGHKGYKTANIPLVPEVKPPQQLQDVAGNRVFILTMKADHLLKIRTERLKAMGLPAEVMYATLERIEEELEYAHALAEQLGCQVIDVTDKAIEETAGIILSKL
ncbi:pyruvate, water dikinase regulatory protein [Paenibacillus marinisediminis]